MVPCADAASGSAARQDRGQDRDQRDRAPDGRRHRWHVGAPRVVVASRSGKASAGQVVSRFTVTTIGRGHVDGIRHVSQFVARGGDSDTYVE